MSADAVVRPATPSDAPALVTLARAVGSEPEGWLITVDGWSGVADERRYLRALRRNRDAAVFVAEAPEGVVGRLSIARDPHPASPHVADLGMMVAASHRRRGLGWALLDEAVRWARTMLPRSPSTSASASFGRGTAGPTTAAATSTSTRS